MKNIAFVFPGQGAQIAGMAKDFYDRFDCSRRIMETACKITGIDLKEICFTEDERLNQTEFTQIALLTAEVMMMLAVKERGILPQVTLGQSLGEYAALITAGALDAADAFRIVRRRGQLMQNAVPLGQGAMVAVIGLPVSLVESFCKQAVGIVQISNYNSEKQTVVSGEREAVLQVKKMAEDAEARLAVELNVSIPSHSELMRPAANELEKVLEHVTFRPLTIPYVANATAEYVYDSGDVAPLLVKQLYSAVRWEQSVRTLQKRGVDLFIEIGPGETMTKLNKKIDRTLNSVHVSTVEELDVLENTME